jgi:hypothetical protein
MKKQELTQLSQALSRWLDRMPLVHGENQLTYYALQAEIKAELKPLNIVEQLLVKDIIEYSWEIARLRDTMIRLQNVGRTEGLENLLLSVGVLPGKAHDIARGVTNKSLHWFLPRKLSERGLDDGAVQALTFVLYLDVIERIDRMIGIAEARRHRVLLELDRRRESRPKQLA